MRDSARRPVRGTAHRPSSVVMYHPIHIHIDGYLPAHLDWGPVPNARKKGKKKELLGLRGGLVPQARGAEYPLTACLDASSTSTRFVPSSLCPPPTIYNVGKKIRRKAPKALNILLLLFSKYSLLFPQLPTYTHSSQNRH